MCFELSVHMLFSGESCTWCNSAYFEVAQHLLLQERIKIQLFFSLQPWERGWTTEQVGVEFLKVGSRFELAEVLCCIRGVQLRGASWPMATEQLCCVTGNTADVWEFAMEIWKAERVCYNTSVWFKSLSNSEKCRLWSLGIFEWKYIFFY